MKNVKIIAILLCGSMSVPAVAQESEAKIIHEMGTMPLNVEFAESMFPTQEYRWKMMPNLYYSRHKEGLNFGWVAMLNYYFRNKPYGAYHDAENYSERNVTLTVAPRYTFGQRANNRLQPYIQLGAYVGHNNAQSTVDYSPNWGGLHSFRNNGFRAGLDMSAGVRWLLTPKFLVAASAQVQVGGEMYRVSGDNFRNEMERTSNTMIYPFQIGVGYIF